MPEFKLFSLEEAERTLQTLPDGTRFMIIFFDDELKALQIESLVPTSTPAEL